MYAKPCYLPLNLIDDLRKKIEVAGTIDVTVQVTTSFVGSVTTIVYNVVSVIVSSCISTADGNPEMVGGWKVKIIVIYFNLCFKVFLIL